MSRGLTTAQANAVNNANNYQTEFLVEILTGQGTNYFYTTGFSDVTQTSVTSGSQTFLASNQLSLVGPLQENYDPNGNELTIQWNTTDTALVGILRQKFLKTRIVISLLFRDPSTNAVVSNANILMYDGYVTSLNVLGSLEEQTIEMKSQSVFRNLTSTRRRTAADIQPVGLGPIYWGTIVWR